MTTQFVPLHEMLEGSEHLHKELAHCIGDLTTIPGSREDVTSVLCTLTFEHAMAMQLLLAGGAHSSALALVRVQFEVLLRAFWIYFAAPETAVAKCVASLPAGATKEPDIFPSVSEMLLKIEGKAPPTITSALTAFKVGAWGAMNSFVHGNLRSMAGHRNGYKEGILSTSMQNANGAAVFATMLLGQALRRSDLHQGAAHVGLTYSRFMPPLTRPSKPT